MDIKFAYAGKGVWRGFKGSGLMATIFLNSLVSTYTAQIRSGRVDLLKGGMSSLAEAQNWIIAKGRILDGKDNR